MDEIWKDIEGYEGLYQVSNLGNVKSVKNGLLKPGNSRGYRRVTIYDNGKPHSFTIHRLVAKAFIPNPENLPCVNHKDENKHNNCYTNLEWCTVSYNNAYGTKGQRSALGNYVPVLMMNKEGEVLKEFDSVKSAAEYCNSVHTNIVKVLTGFMNRETAYGYYWRYKN